MRRFELSEGSSNKFWEVEIAGASFTVRYGRIGAGGQTQTKVLASEAAAKAEAEKLVEEKTGKGYLEVAAAADAKLDSVAPKPPRPSPTPAPAVAQATCSVHWTDEARQKVIPRRGQKTSQSEPMPVAKLLDEVRKAEHEVPSYAANRVAYRWQTLRAALAAASETDYQQALQCARGLWPKLKDILPRCALAYAFPGEAAWASEAVAALLEAVKKDKGRFGQIEAGVALLGAVSDPAQQLSLAKAAAAKRIAIYALTEQVSSMVDLTGAAAAPALEALYETAPTNDHKKDYAAALALIETPEAARALADALGSKASAPVATEYLRRLPALAVPALEQVAKTSTTAAALASQLLKELGPQATSSSSEPKPAAPVWGAEAKAEALPRVLANPPWLSKAQRKAPMVLEVSPKERPDKLVWEKNEQERSKGPTYGFGKKEVAATFKDLEKTVAECTERGNKLDLYVDSWWNAVRFDDATLLEAWKRFPKRMWRSNTASILLARLGERALPEFIGYAVSLRQPTTSKVLVPVASIEVAPIMADGYAGKRSRADAELWLRRHPEIAAVGLVPIAVGKSGAQRDNAGAALRFLVQRGRGDEVRSAAREHGDAVEKAIAEVLAADPSESFPAKLPKMPEFFDPRSLPRLALKGGKGALTAEAVGHLGTMLAFSTPEAPYGGLTQVKAACDPASLEELGWAIYQAWSLAGAPSKEQWAFLACGHLGGDLVARKLTPLIRAWPGEGLHARAVVGLEVLAMIGTDIALMNLHGIAQKVKFKGLQEKAQEKIAQIAENRGLTVDELGDRLVPDLDLDPDGSKVLDFGPRQFRVAFDEGLRPLVKDAEGKRLADLPKQNKSDDAAKAGPAVEAFKLLKKDAKAIASGQIVRLELAMCRQRRWDLPTFKTFLLEHPLMKHLVKLLLWGGYDEKGKLEATFRVAEDGTLADIKDSAFKLASARVGIPHLLELDGKLVEGWGRVFADYQILQPFKQLGRQVFSPAKTELKEKSLDRVKGATVPTGRLLGLLNRGWKKGPPQDAGCIWEWQKPLPGFEDPATLALDPGVSAAGAMEEPQQKLGEIGLPLAAGELDPIAFSELIADVMGLRD